MLCGDVFCRVMTRREVKRSVATRWKLSGKGVKMLCYVALYRDVSCCGVVRGDAKRRVVACRDWRYSAVMERV